MFYDEADVQRELHQNGKGLAAQPQSHPGQPQDQLPCGQDRKSKKISSEVFAVIIPLTFCGYWSGRNLQSQLVLLPDHWQQVYLLFGLNHFLFDCVWSFVRFLDLSIRQVGGRRHVAQLLPLFYASLVEFGDHGLIFFVQSHQLPQHIIAGLRGGLEIGLEVHGAH